MTDHTTKIPSHIRAERSGNGLAWRLSCDRCVQERVVPSLDHCRAVAFVEDHSHCGDPK